MLSLDIRTLSFLAMLSSLLLALGLQIVNRVIKKDSSLRLWAMGATAVGVGFVLLALRGLIPDLFSIVMANTLLVAGVAWQYLGNQAFQGRKGEFPWYWWLTALTAVLFFIFTYLTPNLSVRIVVISTVLAAIRFASALVLLRPSDSHDRLVRWFVAGGYLLTAAFLSARAVLGLFMGPTDQNFMATTSTIQSFAFIFEISLCLILAIGLPLLVLGRTHRLLLAGEQRYRGLIECSPAPMVVHDGAKLLYVNPAAIKMMGARSAQELSGRPVLDLVHPDFRQLAMARAKAALETGVANPVVAEKFIKLDGSIIDVEVQNASILYDDEPAVQVVINDITERNQSETALRQSNEEQEAIFESATSGIAFIKNRVIIKGNHTLDHLFGYLPGEQLGMTTRHWYVDDKAFELGGTPYPALARGEIHQREQQLLRKDGTRFWCRLSGSAIDAGDLSRGTVWMITDVTREHDTVEALHQAKDAAEVANLAKSRFLAAMSHEIRTPMNGILGMAQMLLSPKIDDAARQDYARTVLNSGQSLLTLLNDILDLSKVEAGKIQLESVVFEPAQIIQETRALFAETAAGKGLKIVADESQSPGQRYLGDPYRLRQMLSNLVGNAIKFTDQGKIEIEIQEISRDGQSAVLEYSVTDTGIGIPEDQRQLLFQPFSQTDSSTTRKYGGTGLGLSILSSLAQLMGGEVGVDSKPGQGSRFWFRIQVRLVLAGHDSRNGLRPQQMSTSTEPRLTGRVLVAEDDKTNRKVAEALLRKIGLTPVFVEDGQQALDVVTQGDIADLILMDVHMPIMDGYIATEKIRQWESENGRPRRPIIALTADAFEADQQHCLAVGMDDFLSKPIAIGTLREVLGKWLPEEPITGPSKTDTTAADKHLNVPWIVEILQTLEPLLESNQFDSIGKFKSLQEAVAGTVVADEVEEIAHLLSECRFDATHARLRQLAAKHGWDKTS